MGWNSAHRPPASPGWPTASLPAPGRTALSWPWHDMLEGSDDPVFCPLPTVRRPGSYGRQPWRVVISLYEVMDPTVWYGFSGSKGKFPRFRSSEGAPRRASGRARFPG